jgi:phosphate transport system protein
MPAEDEFPFPRQSNALREAVQDLGECTVKAIDRGTTALIAVDHQAAAQVIADDDVADAHYHRIEDGCLALLGQGVSDALLLRTIVTAQRVAYELERSADLVVNIAKSTRRLRPSMLNPTVETIILQMGRQACAQTAVALDAFAQADPEAAQGLHTMDDVMDDLTKRLFRSVLTDTARDLDEGTVQWAVQIAFIARHYERIADHAVTIGERVQFMVTGVHPGRPETVALRTDRAGGDYSSS